MKKTLVALLFACTSAAFAANGDTEISYTLKTGIYTGNNGGGYSSFALTLNNNSFTGATADTTNAITTATGVQSGESYYSYQSAAVDVSSIALVYRNGDTSYPSGLTLVLTDSSDNVIAASTSYSQSKVYTADIFDSTMGYTRNVGTFTFGAAATLNVGQTYTATFYTNYGEETQATTSLQLFASKTGSGANFSGVDLGASYHSGVYQPGGMTLTAVGAPEPATATLSLLALAGLAARRRRH